MSQYSRERTTQSTLAIQVLATILILAALALPWAMVSRSGRAGLGVVADNVPILFFYCYALIAIAPLLKRTLVVTTLAGSAMVLLFLAYLADFTSIRYFGQPFYITLPYFPVSSQEADFEALAGYLFSYISLATVAISAGSFGASIWIASSLNNFREIRFAVLATIPASVLIAQFAPFDFDPPDRLASALMQAPTVEATPLKRADRSSSFERLDTPEINPQTVLLVILESGGASVPASNLNQLLSTRIIEQSGQDETWFAFKNAVTASNATNISVPVLLTGVAANESYEKLHALPFVSQMASSRGYRTGLVTSSTLRWARFDEFLSTASYDTIWTASDSNRQFINDLAVDDFYAYSRASRFLAETTGRVFLTVYPQALHWPFQSESRFQIHDAVETRQAKASFITETGINLLVRTLKRTNRYEDSLIIIVGDHGEFDYGTQLRLPKMRLDTLREGIISPLFLIKAPNSLPENEMAALRANTRKLVASHDIAPTLAQLFSVQLASDHYYDGYSLFSEIPADRLAFSTATNEWRDWITSTIAVARGNDRLICDSNELCGLYRADGTIMSAVDDAEKEEDLLQSAITDPSMRSALGQVLRGYYE